MKKLVFIALMAVSLLMTSCTKEYVTNVVGGNADMRTVDFNVQSGEWVEYGTFGQQGFGYAVDLDFPEITNNVIEHGMVTLYIKRDNVWTSVPFNYFYQSNDGINYEGGYFYSMKPGVFSIDYYESDHKTQNPGNQIFRLVIVQPV